MILTVFVARYIGFYSTTETADTAYIIGGQEIDSNMVAQYNDDNDDPWKRLPNLNKGRYGHGSILVGDKTLVIGGWARESQELVHNLITVHFPFMPVTRFYFHNFFRIETEVWTHENGPLLNTRSWTTTRPSLPDGNYRYGIGLYAVDFDFCRI